MTRWPTYRNDSNPRPEGPRYISLKDQLDSVRQSASATESSVALGVLAAARAAVDWLCKLKVGGNPDKVEHFGFVGFRIDLRLTSGSLSPGSNWTPNSPNTTVRSASAPTVQENSSHMGRSRLASSTVICSGDCQPRNKTSFFPPDSRLFPTSPKPRAGQELQKRVQKYRHSRSVRLLSRQVEPTLLSWEGQTRSPLNSKGGNAFRQERSGL